MVLAPGAQWETNQASLPGESERAWKEYWIGRCAQWATRHPVRT